MPVETPNSQGKTAGTTLLNDDGSASMATMLMMTHHAFRRDITRFAQALRSLAPGDHARASALQNEWRNYRGALHGHHSVEDESIFPSLRSEHEDMAAVIDGLVADHRHIDPLLDRGDLAFGASPIATDAAVQVVQELTSLLDAHLATEEAHVIPFLRAAKVFPAPAGEAEAGMYAQGFAWSSHGVAPDVLERVYAMLPSSLTSKLPAAREEFEARCKNVWGTNAAGASRTSIPDWLPG